MKEFDLPGTEIRLTISDEGLFIQHLCKSVGFSFTAEETQRIGREIANYDWPKRKAVSC